MRSRFIVPARWPQGLSAWLYRRGHEQQLSLKIGNAMLELRPSCEQCNKPLPPDSIEARICTYECTFCAACVDGILANVCPNCGGGFVPRPIRPSKNWNSDNFLGKDPASTTVKHRPVDAAVHAQFAAAIRIIAPEKR
jgi:uncharacterized protein